jgi:hypothetical protein
MVYMIIMFSWINIVADLAASEIFQKIIGVVALVGAAINLKSWWDSRGKADGCKVVNSKRRSKIIESVKKFTKEKSLVLAILGIIALAVSVNVIELACSAGLPVVFSELLTINNISGVASLPFVLLYILFFMIDDIIVFTIAMTATRIAGLSTKYNKYSHLIGGLIMLIIGILLLFYPKALMMGM